MKDAICVSAAGSPCLVWFDHGCTSVVFGETTTTFCPEKQTLFRRSCDSAKDAPYLRLAKTDKLLDVMYLCGIFDCTYAATLGETTPTFCPENKPYFGVSDPTIYIVGCWLETLCYISILLRDISTWTIWFLCTTLCQSMCPSLHWYILYTYWYLWGLVGTYCGVYRSPSLDIIIIYDIIDLWSGPLEESTISMVTAIIISEVILRRN
jgi:hypothetical protein